MQFLVFCDEDLGLSGGGSRQVLEFSKALVALQHEVTIVAPQPIRQERVIPDWSRLIMRPISVVRRGGLRPISYLLGSWLTLRRELDERRPDVLVWFDSPGQMAPLLALHNRTCPYVYFVNGLPHEEVQGVWQRTPLRQLLSWGLKRAAKHAQAVVSVCPEVLTSLRCIQDMDTERCIVIRNGVDPDRFVPQPYEGARAKLGLTGAGPYIGFVGGFFPWHGLESLIQAVPIVAKIYPAVQFLLVGEGQTKHELEESVQQAGLTANVTFVGRVEFDEVPMWIGACDVCVVLHRPTRSYPGDSMKLWEYLACGRPVVATAGAGYGDTIEAMGAGLATQVNDPQDLARQLLKLLGDQELRSKMGERGRTAVLEAHTWEARGKQLEQVCREAVTRMTGANRNESSLDDVGERTATLQIRESMPRRLRHRILEAGGWVGMGFGIDKCLAMCQLMVVARLLTPADLGLVAASAAVLLAVSTLTEMGLEPAIVARKEVKQDDLAVAWTLAVCRACLLAGGIWISADVVAQFMRMPELAALLRVHSCVLLIQSAKSPALILLLKNLDVRRRTQLNLISRTVEVVVTVCLTWWLRSVWALVYGQIVGLAINSLLSYRIAPFVPRITVVWSSLREFVRFGAHANIANLLAFGVLSGSEFIIGRMMGREALGYYLMALVIPSMVGIRVPTVLWEVSLPVYSALQRDRQGIIRAFGVQFGTFTLALLPVAGILALMAPEIIAIMAGEQWGPAAPVLRALSMFSCCSALASTMGVLHYGLQRPELPTKVWGWQFIAYGALIGPLVVTFGLMGAVWALNISYMVGLVLWIYYTLQLLGHDAALVFGPLLRTIVPVIVVLGGGLFVQDAQLLPLNAINIGLCIAAGVGMYTLYVWRVEYPRLLKLWHA